MQRVVTMTIQAPPPELDKPLPPLPPPPPPKKQPPKPKDKEAAQKKSPAPKPDANPQQADPSHVGMDAQSFAAGGDGPGFRVGGNQMGDPNKYVPPAPKVAPEVKKAKPPVKYSIARPKRGAGLDTESLFNARARKLGLSGLMILELEIDERGRVRTGKVRQGLEPQFDREVLAFVKKNVEFEPPGSSGAGRAVTNVTIYRARFNLER
jgi:TonB family protein